MGMRQNAIILADIAGVEFMFKRMLIVQLISLCLAGSACAAPQPDESVPGGRHPPRRHPPSHGPQKLDLPEADYSLWYRYYQAGEDASITHHDLELAKKYWLAALSELEKSPPSRTDMFLAIKLSALEKGLQDLYPTDWSKQNGDPDDVLKLRKQQVDTLYRIARVNDRIVPHDDLLFTKSQERYQLARKEYEKALQLKKQGASEKS
jgi:hypothetical protein